MTARYLSLALVLAVAACIPKESTRTTTVSTQTVTSRVYVPIPVAASSASDAPVAAGTPSFDCSALKPTVNGIENVICNDAQLVDLDNEMARLYLLADASAGAGADTLHRLQKAWLDQRNSTCGRSADARLCLVNAYAERIHDLRAGYAAARDETGASHGPVNWQCPGSDLPLSTTFINGRTSVAYVRWGGQSVILPQAVSGSGARYAGDGYEAWNKSNALMWTVPQKAMVSCTKVS